jgi:hypothetical protein
VVNPVFDMNVLMNMQISLQSFQLKPHRVYIEQRLFHKYFTSSAGVVFHAVLLRQIRNAANQSWNFTHGTKIATCNIICTVSPSRTISFTQ